MTTLTAAGVTAGYGRRVVLSGCDLSVSSGELVAIVGPNGAGKSTLLRALSGLLRPTAGAVRFDGADVATLSRGELARRIAVVPQHLETLFTLTVREIVGLGRTARLGILGRPSATDVAVVDATLRTLEVEALADRPIDALSGGERQRAVLAMALAQEARVLLLDEPTVHLDPGHQIATLELVRSLGLKEGLAVVAVLHDLNLAAMLATRVVVMSRGAIIRDGRADDVLTQTFVREIFGPGLEVIAHGGRALVVPAAPRRDGGSA